MAFPKILISSTCYDLKELRNSIEKAIKELSYEPILSDKNDVLFDPQNHTHVSCINAVEECDMAILVMGGRFGGKAVPQALDLIKIEESNKAKAFINNFNQGEVSITQLEILKAFERKIPVFTFISDYLETYHHLYEVNKGKPELKMIDFPNIEKKETVPYICEFLNYIRYKKSNNAYFSFKNATDLIETFKKQLAFYFRELLKKQREIAEIPVTTQPSYVYAKIVKHTSRERTSAFKDLFTQVDTKDEIKILGTGVTNFLGQEDEVEEYLKNENLIKILMVNDQIMKKDWACSSQKFLKRFSIALNSANLSIINELEAKTYCPLASLNVLIDSNHFNHYYAKDNYIRKVIRSYKLIEEYQKKIKKYKWGGTLEVKHFNSFVPMSITAIFPDHSEQRKLLAEFIIPFTENRILLKSSLQENPDIYNLFVDFFDETWKRAEAINFQLKKSKNNAD